MDIDNNTKGNGTDPQADSNNENQWVYLTTAKNDFEYNLIKGKLEQNNIACIGKGRDMDLLDSGFLKIVLGPCIPVEIMVHKEVYDEALGIINLEVSNEELEEQAMSSGQHKDEE